MPLDPLLAARLAACDALGPDATQADVDALYNQPFGPLPTDDLVITERSVDGPHGPVPVRVYAHPSVTPGANVPALVWCHGGAFMHGDLEMPESDQTARVIADQIGGVVVAVDYRLVGDGNPPSAPPVPDDLLHQYPVALDDVVAAWLWTLEHSTELGIDPDRLAIGGASAGANLISAAVVRLRDEQRPLPHVWLPIYPVVHVTKPDFSAELDADLAEIGSGFNDEALTFIGDVYGATADDPYGYVGERDDLQGLPRCLIVNDQYDELRGSGEAFAAQLAAAGVDVTCTMAAGMKHGHLNLIGHPVTLQTLHEMADEITR